LRMRKNRGQKKAFVMVIRYHGGQFGIVACCPPGKRTKKQRAP
jgi:hypothetical protein